jgi:hypothetical protein
MRENVAGALLPAASALLSTLLLLASCTSNKYVTHTGPNPTYAVTHTGPNPTYAVTQNIDR